MSSPADSRTERIEAADQVDEREVQVPVGSRDYDTDDTLITTGGRDALNDAHTPRRIQRHANASFDLSRNRGLMSRVATIH